MIVQSMVANVKEQLIPVMLLILAPKKALICMQMRLVGAQNGVCILGGGVLRSFLCALPIASVSMQLIKGRASIDYSHVVKRRLFCSPLIKDVVRRKSRFIIILMLVWACGKTERK